MAGPASCVRRAQDGRRLFSRLLRNSTRTRTLNFKQRLTDASVASIYRSINYRNYNQHGTVDQILCVLYLTLSKPNLCLNLLAGACHELSTQG